MKHLKVTKTEEETMKRCFLKNHVWGPNIKMTWALLMRRGTIFLVTATGYRCEHANAANM